jgi:hypothetical protein
MAGTCPQNLVKDCKRAQVQAFFANRQAKHFNLAQVDIIALEREAPVPVDAYGNRLFLHGESFEPTNLNLAYLNSIDFIIDAAAAHGHYIMIDLPVYNLGGTNFYDRIPAAEYYHLGQFLGKRWKNRSHMLFMLGNDGFISQLENQLWNGIKESMPMALTTTDANRTDFAAGPEHFIQPYEYRYARAPNELFSTQLAWLTLDGWYHYLAPSYMAAQEYARPERTMPAFIAEAQYEKEDFGRDRWHQSDGSARMIRNEIWAEVLWGGSGFGIYGYTLWNGATERNQDSAGAYSAQYCTEFFTSRAWYDLVPDSRHTFLVSQGSTPPMHDEFYTNAALTPDGKLGVIYYPGNGGNGVSLKVNLGKMASRTAAEWFDPSSAAYREADGSPFPNSGEFSFVTPGANAGGDNDWVLVLESK